MNISKTLLAAVAATCIALLGAALYLQLAQNMYPCPYCILMRYAFSAVALFCIVALALPAMARRVVTGAGVLFALIGAALAGKHAWILAHPDTSCGMEPWENAMNHLPTAEMFPKLFKATGMCTDIYEPIMGLEIPEWALLWFLLLAAALVAAIALDRKNGGRKLFK
jgi:disulfide bond formation protein DsbB